MAMMDVKCKGCGKQNRKKKEERAVKCSCGFTTIYAVFEEANK